MSVAPLVTDGGSDRELLLAACCRPGNARAALADEWSYKYLTCRLVAGSIQGLLYLAIPLFFTPH